MASSMRPGAEQRPVSTMAARGMRPAAVLGAARPHGDRLRYMAGCRCSQCRRANSSYETMRARAHKTGDWNGLVPAEPARLHLQALSKAGIGRRQVADASGISETVICQVRSGQRLNVRAATAKRILAVTADARADASLVPAGPTWKLLDALLSTGYSKAALARELGFKTPALQIGRGWVLARTAYRVQRMFDRFRRVPSGRAERLVRDLRDEGYRMDRIHAMAAECAKSMGCDVPDFCVHRGYISAIAVQAIERLHGEVTRDFPATGENGWT